MGKTRFKSKNTRDWEDDDDHYENDRHEKMIKRREKKLRNIIRSKDINKLLELDEQDEDYA
jgi:hypothetical protein